MKQTPPKPFDPVPALLIVAGLALIVGVILWQFGPSLQNTTAPQSTNVNNNVITPTDIPEGDIPRVTLADARTAFNAKTAVFVDVRSLDSFQAGHIPGALSIPLADIGDRLNEISPQQWIITYCT